ncbi:hypothetical protein DPMN_166083 [Dreissena polymorpha]|uniref:Uncharacterized protein n=1 Tax=Dreissena polymorpha TaxID=45954 RepID=A0A9D4ITU9_DREPO|nr:hypothetical protein DPMN_166083 [Dreissena polymorpha]
MTITVQDILPPHVYHCAGYSASSCLSLCRIFCLLMSITVQDILPPHDYHCAGYSASS